MTPPSVRVARANDINHVVDIDLKSYDYPWPVEKWRKFIVDPTCITILASFKAEPVGVCVWQKKPAVDEAEILKLATKPAHRNKGVATFLLNAVQMTAIDYGLKLVTIIVPEINCFPGHPDDVSQWLLEQGYKAITPILKNHFYMYGKKCDGFKFTCTIGEEDA